MTNGTMSTQEKWDGASIATREHVLEGVGYTIVDAKLAAPLRWIYLDTATADAIRSEGFDALCAYGFDA